MIPKKIHYCWFGHGKKSKLAQKCIRSWKKYCPDYEIIEWNEETYDISSAPLFVRQALEAKKWAFATDYIRYQVVYEHGGIYFDTDVEVLKSIDKFRSDKGFFGFQYNDVVASGLGFGAEKGLPILKDLMRNYEENLFILPDGEMDTRSCQRRDASVFESFGLVTDGSEQMLEGGIHLYPREYLGPRSNCDGKLRITENTYSIHWYEGSWRPKRERLCIKTKRVLTRILGKERASRLKRALMKKRQEK